MGCSLLVFSLMFVISFWFRATQALDNLIRYEYENLRDQWEKDGQPRGMFWKPPSPAGNRFKRMFLGNPGIAALKLTFVTPAWARLNTEAAKYLKRYRQFVLFWNIGLLVWFFVIFPSLIVVFTPR